MEASFVLFDSLWHGGSGSRREVVAEWLWLVETSQLQPIAFKNLFTLPQVKLS